ncbi:MAG: diadenylate cyclase CdaA [Halothece sp.]
MPSQGLSDLLSWLPNWSIPVLDLSLAFALVYLAIRALGETKSRPRWVIQGFIIFAGGLLALLYLSEWLELTVLPMVVEKMLIGASVGMVVILQSEFRRFLEQLGRGEVQELFPSSRNDKFQPDNVLDQILDAVRELSQKRIGALLLLETNEPIDPREYRNEGVILDAEISSELIQTLFQTTTVLHDGAVVLRGSRVAAASVILPLTEKSLSRQLGTRHRAAIGITERVSDCLCIIISEETGSISLAEQGNLQRPLTRSRLRELLELRFAPAVERETVAKDFSRLTREISSQGKAILSKSVHFLKSKSKSNRKK